MAWYICDVKFRHRASHNHSLKWGGRDIQLYLDMFTGVPKSILCRQCSRSDHFTHACHFPVGPGTPKTHHVMTSATPLTRVFPMPALPAPTSISSTNLDAQGPTMQRTTPIHPAPDASQLPALGIPPEAVPSNLSSLSPPTSIDIPILTSYLHDHPDRVSVDFLLTGLSQGFKIGFQGSWVPKEHPNLISARNNPSIVSNNILKEVKLGHTAGPFPSPPPPPFPNMQVYRIGVIPKKHSTEWRTIFHLSYPKHHPTSVNAHISPLDYSLHYITVDSAISVIQELGQACFMSKLDIKSAFRNIPFHPSATRPPRRDCRTALSKILCLFAELNIPAAPGKTFALTTSLEFMGVLLDSAKMEARLPLDKLTRTREALNQWSHRKSTTLKELQSLIGTLQLACRVVVPERAFLQWTIGLTRGIPNSRWHIKLNAEFRKDISMWLTFLNHWNGASFFLGDSILSSPELQLFADAFGSLDYAGYLNGQWFQGRWLPQHLTNPATGISIDRQEIFAIYIACYLWGPSWSGKRICMWCDNLPVVTFINSKCSRSPRIMDLVCSITILNLLFNFTFSAKHTPGLDNSIADSLPRFWMDHFHSLAPNASPTPCIIPTSATTV